MKDVALYSTSENGNDINEIVINGCGNKCSDGKNCIADWKLFCMKSGEYTECDSHYRSKLIDVADEDYFDDYSTCSPEWIDGSLNSPGLFGFAVFLGIISIGTIIILFVCLIYDIIEPHYRRYKRLFVSNKPKNYILKGILWIDLVIYFHVHWWGHKSNSKLGSN